MGRVWILDTETKGTGANMVPLDSVVAKPSAPREPMVARRRPRERPAEEPEPKRPPEFKVVDVMTREVLAENAPARAMLDVLKGVRSVVDVHIYSRRPGEERWRALTHGEQRAIWDLRDR
jgi:hypothetical protein